MYFIFEAESFTHLQLTTLNSEKDQDLKKEKTLFKTNMILCKIRFENIKI